MSFMRQKLMMLSLVVVVVADRDCGVRLNVTSQGRRGYRRIWWVLHPCYGDLSRDQRRVDIITPFLAHSAD